MKGKILDFSLQQSEGVITCDDGSRYVFSVSEWKEQTLPVRGMSVDFAVENGRAVGVYRALGAQPVSASVGTGERPNSLFGLALACVTRNYANFSGRATRSEYWGFVLFSCLAYFVIAFVLALLGGSEDEINTIIGLLGLALFLPSLAVAVRRLHDTDRSGWWLLLGLIPFVGAVVLLVFYCQDSRAADNRYGANPKIL